MKVVKIERGDHGIFIVHLIPSFLEKLLGVKPKCIKYRDSDIYYPFGGQTKYIREDGSSPGNWDRVSQKIDKFRNRY